jgi:hypothetical protein
MLHDNSYLDGTLTSVRRFIHSLYNSTVVCARAPKSNEAYREHEANSPYAVCSGSTSFARVLWTSSETSNSSRVFVQQQYIWQGVNFPWPGPSHVVEEVRLLLALPAR